jgi:replicative DNA helicase
MSLEYEQRLLGAAILDNGLLDGERITVDLFDSYHHRIIFEAALAMRTVGKLVNLVTLADELGDRLADAGGTAYLASLTSVDCAGNADFYVKVLREQADRKALRKLAQGILEAGERAPVEGLLAAAETAILGVRQRGSDTATLEPREVLHAVIEKAERRMKENAEGPSGIPSGFRQLDAATGGFQPGDLILVAARTSVGKSSLALSFIEKQLRKGIKVSLASLESPAVQVAERLIAMRSGVNTGRMRFGHLSETDLGEMMQAASGLYDASLRILDKVDLSVSALRSWAHGEVAKGAQIIYCDYAGLLRGGDDRAPRWERMSEVSRGLKGIARELSIPLVVLAQLNREAADSREPGLHHLRDSGSFEQDADIILILQRTEKEGADDMVPAWVRIAKHRNGPCGKIDLVFHRSTTQFAEEGNHA